MDEKKYYFLIGSYFGYPKCCIDFFINSTIADRQESFSVGKRSGFVPCPNHTQMIKKGEIQLEDLIRNRVCRENFPTNGNLSPDMIITKMMHIIKTVE